MIPIDAATALAAQWREDADRFDTTARAYNRSCVKHKGMQLTLLAKQARTHADAIEALASSVRDGTVAETTQGPASA